MAKPPGDNMGSLRLFLQLTVYYGAIGAVTALAIWTYPAVVEFLPIGGTKGLLNAPNGTLLTGSVDIGAGRVQSLGESLLWLAVAIAGALLTALPVSWTYIEVRNQEEYDQSLVETIVVLPIAVTSIIVIVHDSLALAFSLAGVVGAVRFRNTLKSSGDALFVLLAIGIGLASGIGALELAILMSFAFNYCFLVLWTTDYGARNGGRRYMRSHVRPREDDDSNPEAAAPIT